MSTTQTMSMVVRIIEALRYKFEDVNAVVEEFRQTNPEEGWMHFVEFVLGGTFVPYQYTVPQIASIAIVANITKRRNEADLIKVDIRRAYEQVYGEQPVGHFAEENAKQQEKTQKSIEMLFKLVE